MKSDEKFIGYVIGFYGPGGLYNFFDPAVTKEEVEAALRIRKANNDPPFSGDSFDRELVRDIMKVLRGNVKDLEYPIVIEWVNAGNS